MIYVGADHAGQEAKKEVLQILQDRNIPLKDLSPEAQAGDDYPQVAKQLCEQLEEEDRGILICGSGVGMSIAANRLPGIRAVLALDEYAARKARQDEDANVLCLRSREFDHSRYEAIIITWLNTPASKEERHVRRRKQLEEMRS